MIHMMPLSRSNGEMIETINEMTMTNKNENRGGAWSMAHNNT